jgi:hypothetical protein
MMHDPLDPPAIVQPAQDIGDVIFADRLNTLMSEAQSFGRKTIEQAVECGRRLIATKAEIDRYNEGVRRRKDKIEWAGVLNQYGFSQPTAWRLMTKAKSANSQFKMNCEMDRIYDDGYDPTADAGKKPCRDCRHRGKKFNRGCPGCRALNRPTPAPNDAGPVTDEDGYPVPAHLVEAFQDGRTIREFGNHLLKGVKSLVGLSERPGCSAINAVEIAKRLRTLNAYAYKYRPGYVHRDCEGQGCDACGHRGWFTVMQVADERAAEANRKKRARAKEWHARQASRDAHGRVSNEPLPE